MGSKSDLAVMEKAATLLERLLVPYELTIVSAHRTPLRMVNYAQTAHERGLKVIIAGAGGAAHLPGMVASLTLLPVIGVPVLSSNSLQGWDSLLSIVQMPTGIPVATVAINNAENAAILAARMLAPFDPDLQSRLAAHRQALESAVLTQVEEIANKGWQPFV
jgi:5-(carboxyamino)imidazole ribonucleotide mutase